VEASQTNPIASSGTADAEARVTVFVCANCARAGSEPAARFGRPALPALGWPGTVQQVAVPCTGRLQPEHLLRAFEAGADVVGVVACARDNCHYLEGATRAIRRTEYVGGLLDEIGLGAGRLMLFHLPGSARADMAQGVARPVMPPSDSELSSRLQAIAEQVAQRLRGLPPSPLRPPGAGAVAAPQTDEPAELSDVEEEEESDE
jgi:F420-non-reducing hydrogenase iron-sulfur subunit